MRTKKVPLLYLIIIIVVFVIWLLIGIEDKIYTLQGTYQTENVEEGAVALVFQEDRFLETIGVQYVDFGTYKEVEKNVYILKSDSKDDYIILDKDTFYYYIKDLKEPRVLKFKQISTSPSYFISDEGNPMYEYFKNNYSDSATDVALPR